MASVETSTAADNGRPIAFTTPDCAFRHELDGAAVSCRRGLRSIMIIRTANIQEEDNG
jgi:hypothetical protein